MANSLTINTDLIIIFVVFQGLLAPGLLACHGVGPHPLSQESIVPERDLTPRNFNPHPYVSVAGGLGGVKVLFNFDHPYAGVASKRSGYFRNGPNRWAPERLDKDNDRAGKTSINSLANFARRFLGLQNDGDGYNVKRPVAAWNNDAVIDNDALPAPLKILSTIPISNYLLDGEDPLISGAYRTIEYPSPRSQNGQNIAKHFSDGSSDGDGDGNGRRIGRLPTSILELEDHGQRQKLYREGKTLNLASVQQSSPNEDALSPRDTNDNLSQGCFAATCYENLLSNDPHPQSEFHRKALYFITSNRNYHANSIINESDLSNNRYYYHSYL